MASSNESFNIFKLLQDQVKDLKFVDDDEKLKDYVCCACGYVAISHCIVNCDAVLCSKCYQRYYQKPCPSCNVTLTSNKLDKEFEADVLQLKVKCKFTKNGCTEIVSLINFMKHAKSCKFAAKIILPEINEVTKDLQQVSDNANFIKEESGRIQTVVTRLKRMMLIKEQNDDSRKRPSDTLTEVMAKQLQKLDTKVQECINQMDETKAEHQSELQKLEAKVQERINHMNESNAEHQSELQNLETKVHECMNQIDKAKAEHQSKQQKLETKVQECMNEMDEAKAEHQSELQKLETKVQECMNQMDEAKAEHKSELHKLEAKVQESMNRIDEAKAEHQSKIEEAIKITEDNCNRKMENFQAEFKKEIQTLKAEHKKRIDELQDVESQQERHLDILENQVTDLQYHHKDDCGGLLPSVFRWKIQGIAKIIKDLTEKKPFTYQKEECFTNTNGEKFKPLIYTAKGHENVFIYLQFMTGNNYSEANLHSRRFILIDQSTSMRKNNVEMVDEPKFKKNSAEDMRSKALTSSLFFPLCLLLSENNYVKNDAVLIKIILEPIAFLWKQIESQNGVLLWRINDYSKKKRNEIDGVKRYLVSKPFKTSHVGYTAHLELYLNGEGSGEGKYITIFLRFLLGEHDESLPLPFKCKYSFCLIDQTDSPTKENIREEFTDKFKECDLNMGYDLALQRTVESSKYLKNDSIAIQTTVTIL